MPRTATLIVIVIAVVGATGLTTAISIAQQAGAVCGTGTEGTVCGPNDHARDHVQGCNENNVDFQTANGPPFCRPTT
jgi:hypothetical protein